MPRFSTGVSRRTQQSNGKGTRLAVILCVVSLTLFTLSCREAGSGPITTVRGAVTVVTMPVRYLGALISTPFSSLGNVFANLTADQETLSELRAENEELTSRNAQLEEAEQTAERLQDLLDLQSTYNLESTAANVIASSTDSWSSTVTIDKGTTSGLAVGMPVCDSSGVIGQISECGATSSVVRLITDEGSSVSAMIQSSRAQGMLEGSADGTLRLSLVRTDQTVEVGDLVVTSGLGGVYPKGLPLGRVTNIERTSGSLYYSITVRSLSSTDSFEEVIVITSLTQSQQATSDDYAEADAQDTADQTTGSGIDTQNNSDNASDESDGQTDSSEG